MIFMCLGLRDIHVGFAERIHTQRRWQSVQKPTPDPDPDPPRTPLGPGALSGSGVGFVVARFRTASRTPSASIEPDGLPHGLYLQRWHISSTTYSKARSQRAGRAAPGNRPPLGGHFLGAARPLGLPVGLLLRCTSYCRRAVAVDFVEGISTVTYDERSRPIVTIIQTCIRTGHPRTHAGLADCGLAYCSLAACSLQPAHCARPACVQQGNSFSSRRRSPTAGSSESRTPSPALSSRPQAIPHKSGREGREWACTVCRSYQPPQISRF